MAEARRSVWLAEPKPARRGTAPTGLSRERIVQEAVRLLDEQGLPGFSMRKLAAALDVTPMSVYWYVDNKDDLLELALDQAFADVRLDPLTAQSDWAEHIKTLARQYRLVFRQHLWATRLVGEFLAFGPHAVFVVNSAIEAIGRSGLPEQETGSALGLVFQYVYGFATAETQWLTRVRRSGVDEEALHAEIVGEARAIDAELMEKGERMRPEMTDGLQAARDRDFEDGLDLAIAGIRSKVAQLRTADQER